MRAATALIAVLLLSSCERPTNFSQFPGFAEYFARNPPKTEPPSEADRALLRRYRPRLFVAEGFARPIRFYEDYIAQGRLTDGGGRLISGNVTPEILNAHKERPRAVFEHRPAGEPGRPALYGRVDRERFTLRGRERAFTFLTWNAVFRVSGIGAGIDWWKGALLGLAGDLDDWHQLDHYTAVTLALDETGNPVAVSFQQHNYRQTRVFGHDIDRPPDGRVAVDVALRSNEFYPHSPERRRRRAVGFISPANVDYLVTGRDPPFRAADDITAPSTEIDYELLFLAPSDAFYTFKGFLGEKRLLPGRSGPPGADYNTLPDLKPLHRQMIAFHWYENDTEYANWFREGQDGLAKLRQRFAEALESGAAKAPRKERRRTAGFRLLEERGRRPLRRLRVAPRDFVERERIIRPASKHARKAIHEGRRPGS